MKYTITLISLGIFFTLVTGRLSAQSLLISRQVNSIRTTSDQKAAAHTTNLLISSVLPEVAPPNSTVSIIGSGFSADTKVTINDVPALNIKFITPELITADIPAGATVGAATINVTNAGQTIKFKSLTIVAHTPPGATDGISADSFTPQTGTTGTIITIQGDGFADGVKVTIGGQPAASVTVVSAKVITATVGTGATGPVIVTQDSQTANAGQFTFAAAGAENAQIGALADFTLPDLGKSGFNVIATPSFTLLQSYTSSKRLGIQGTFWGNATTLDSAKQKVSADFMLPQGSMLGVNVRATYIFTSTDNTDAMLGFTGEVNALFKKVNFVDTTSNAPTGTKGTTFSPFVMQPKFGLFATFFKGYLTFAYQYNILTVLSANADFNKFFNVNKNVFVYPEVNGTYLFDITGSTKQQLKLEIDALINNKDARMISNNGDKVIPYLKIGFTSAF